MTVTIAPAGDDVPPFLIVRVVAAHYGLTVTDLRGPGTTRTIRLARHIAMYLCRRLTVLSYAQIGSALGGRDHTSAMHAERTITVHLSEDRSLEDDLANITARLIPPHAPDHT